MSPVPPVTPVDLPAIPASFAESYYTLAAGTWRSSNWLEDSSIKEIPIDVIAEQVYGKPYSSLRGCERHRDNIPNDTYLIFRLANDEEYEEALDNFDETSIYLGYNPQTKESVIKEGMTQLEYWLSIKIDPTPGAATVEPNPPAYTDLENAVFEEAFFADRVFSPSLEGVLADLIRRGVLPKANYIFDHSW